MMPLIQIAFGNKSFPQISSQGEQSVRAAPSPVDQAKVEMHARELRARRASDRRAVADTALGGAQARLNGLRQAAQTALILGDTDALKRLARDSLRVTRQIEDATTEWQEATGDLYQVSDETSRASGATDPMAIAQTQKARQTEISKKSDQVQSMLSLSDFLITLAAHHSEDIGAGKLERELTQRRARLHNGFKSLKMLDVSV